MTNSKKDSALITSGTFIDHQDGTSTFVPDSKKDSELEEIEKELLKVLLSAKVELNNYYGYNFDLRDDALDELKAYIKSKYITKEESDRRVLEGRIDELQTHGDQWRVWLDDTKNVKLIYVVNWYDLRIAELSKLLNGDKDGISKRD